jgi:HupE / UreJ protein
MKRRRPCTVFNGLTAAGALSVILALAAAPALAHKPSDSYLTLDVRGDALEVRWDLALRDLDNELGLDTDDDGILTWGEVQHREADMRAFAFAGLKLQSGGAPCEVPPTGGAPGLQLDRHSDGTYAVLRQTLRCPLPIRRVDVEYRLFASSDPSHRGIVRVSGGGLERSAVMGPDMPVRQFELSQASVGDTLRDFVREGIRHIWFGFDHILFLLALLLPSVLARRSPDALDAAESTFRLASMDVIRIVTAFTVAHSITLTLAVLDLVALPSRLVESVIALTVILAAANNIWPVMRERRWLAAFGFGLFHGFGFAGALRDLGLPSGALAVSLFGFNLGVEIGQLAIVSVFFPVAYAWRGTRWYRYGVVRVGSGAIALMAGIWLVERGFDLRLMPV